MVNKILYGKNIWPVFRAKLRIEVEYSLAFLLLFHSSPTLKTNPVIFYACQLVVDFIFEPFAAQTWFYAQ